MMGAAGGQLRDARRRKLTLSERLDAYERLMRLDKPIGTLLLLWPTLSALWLAAGGAPRLSLVLIFCIGTLVMRSAGCAMNDWADRDFDGRVAETRPRRAHTPRARRRVAAEERLRSFATRNGVLLSILRVPGIYAPTRLPLERLKHGTPALAPDDDVYTNHVHADDLARAVVAAMYHGRPNRAYNVSDDSDMKMGAWFDAVADAFHLPRPPRVGWEAAERQIAPALLSFMSESRRLSNDRLKRELRLRLMHPTPHAMLAQVAPRALTRQLALPSG